MMAAAESFDNALRLNSVGIHSLLTRPTSQSPLDANLYDQTIREHFTSSIQGVKQHLERSCQQQQQQRDPESSSCGRGCCSQSHASLCVSTHAILTSKESPTSSSSGNSLFVWNRLLDVQAVRNTNSMHQHDDHENDKEASLGTYELGEFFGSVLFNLALHYQHAPTSGGGGSDDSDRLAGQLYQNILEFCDTWGCNPPPGHDGHGGCSCCSPQEQDEQPSLLLPTLRLVALNNLGSLQYLYGQLEDASVTYATLATLMDQQQHDHLQLLSREDQSEIRSNCVLVLYQRRHGACAQAA